MAQLNGTFTWKQHAILTSELCNEDVDREIRLEFYKSQKSGTHSNLGYISFTIAELREGTREFVLLKKNKASPKEKVQFTVANFNTRHSFLEYVFGGTEIQLCTAIDFTLSNGHPQDKDSLHYLDMQRNEYLKAIESVGSIL